MVLRANITTTYQETSVNPPRAINNLRTKAADQVIQESEVVLHSMKPEMRLRNRGKNPPGVGNNDRNHAKTDVFERSSPKDRSMVAQGTESNKPAFATVVDRSQNMQAGSMVSKVEPLEFAKTDGSQGIPTDDEPQSLQPSSQSLPLAAPPRIRLANPSTIMANGNNTENSSNLGIVPASVLVKKSDQSSSGVVTGPVFNSPDEDTMLSELTTALQFGQTPESDSQTDYATGSDVAKHLQSEGVFGISASGRNLGAADFIRQKQFEYSMDQKPFTTDDLLVEAEKAIHGTLNSDQSSTVNKSLLKAAESINAYRNQSVKSSERAEITAKPVRAAKSTGKEKA